MEPDVVRMYSSSPPPLDEDGEEEDEDDFGEFGGYSCGVSSSFSFSEYDTPTAFNQSYETDTSPPDLYNTFTQSVGQQEKELAFEDTEKITKDREAPYTESLVCETDDAVDCENGKLEVSKVLINGPLSPDSQGEHSVVSIVGKHSTSELQDFKLGGKDEHSDNPNTYQVEHCLSNGPITLCTGKELEWPPLTSASSTESVLASRADDSSTETDKASRSKGPIDSHELLEDNISQKEAEARDTLAGNGVNESQEVDSNLAGEDQSNKEKMEKEEMEDDTLSGLCGPSGASFCEIKIQSGSEDLGDVADTSLAPVAENIQMSGAQFKENVENCNEIPVSPVVKGSLVVPGRVEQVEEDFEEVCLPVVDPTVGMVHDEEAYLVIREAKRIVGGSSVESDEDFGDFRDATQGFPDVSQTESLSQEGFADFVTALSDCSSHDEFADTDTLKDLKEEEELAAEDDEDDDDDDNNNHEMMCSELPPSDSFADFSSAPFGGLAGSTGESWAEFGQHEEYEEQQESWAAFDEEQKSSTATAPSTDSLRSDNVLFGLSHKLQHLFESTFPSEMAPEDSDVLTLQTLLEPQDHAEIRESVAMWRHLLDIHSAHGLKVQWVGSHSNRVMLDCLGIYNILFTGQNKQPVIVPMFAAGLGMLEPTKEPVKPSSIFSASSPGQGRSALCTQQVVSSLSFEDDAPGGAVTQLNLDFFGPMEDCSSDSDTDTPMPGVDPELYELTTAKLESSNTGSNVADAFTRLMETVEKNSTVTRKPERDGEISQEAAHVISLLPNLSFMHARVLMFPSTLTPAASHP
ncbi:aftiphilin isoform X1 [Pangasianodon hypophthalmus]|uniref:aftiphilin isoform X1 n=1 Tax=Pangasianodon hypophthalmus TaxID=310915 RepID=UPI002307B938|nr:aftiphilin isoform X1 [Pangasianodon hypophthalmus]